MKYPTKSSSSRSSSSSQPAARHPASFLEGKTGTLQSGGDKQHGRHGNHAGNHAGNHGNLDSAHGSMSSSSKSSASYLSLSKSHSALSDAAASTGAAKSVGNLSDPRLHPDDPSVAIAAGAGTTGGRFFPASCMDLNAPQGPPPGSPSGRHGDRSGHSPSSRGGGPRMESSTLDSSARRTRHKTTAHGR